MIEGAMGDPASHGMEMISILLIREVFQGTRHTTKAFIPYFRERRFGLLSTKWALEGWSESMAFELSQFGIGLKTVEAVSGSLK